MRVLVTGGSGFIGSRLLPALQARGHEVRVLDLVVRPGLEAVTQQGDVADAGAVAAALQGVDMVFHLAAEHRDDVLPIEKYYRTNVEGMRVLCAGMQQAGIRRMVFTSSVAIYGFRLEDGAEDSAPTPDNHYGKSKHEAEQVLSAWLAADAGNVAQVMRPCVVFGPGNRGNVYNLFRQVMARRFLMIGDGGNRKSMAYVDNIVDALLFLADRPESVVVNYADKPDMSMDELVRVIARAGGVAVPPLRLPRWLGHAAGHALDIVARASGRQFPLSAVRVTKFCANSVVNADRIRGLGFVPRHALADGIARTIAADFAGAPAA
jgi:nucleoside-diphosphate-sugar epimerase